MLAGIGAFLGPCTAQAQQNTRWEHQVKTQLKEAALALDVLSEGDVEEAYRPYIGNLRYNQYQDVTYRLTEGVTYVIVGACDEDCPDLDLKLFHGGELVKQDTAPDATPTIVFRPAWTGNYTLRVIMAKCNKNPCWYGVGAYK